MEGDGGEGMGGRVGPVGASQRGSSFVVFFFHGRLGLWARDTCSYGFKRTVHVGKSFCSCARFFLLSHIRLAAGAEHHT